jgi:hypothetical protein
MSALTRGPLIDRVVRAILDVEPHVRAQRLLSVALHAWVLTYLLSLVPMHRLFWGPEALQPMTPFDPRDPWDWAFRALLDPRLSPHYGWFVAFALVSSAVGLSGRAPRVSALVSALLLKNLDARAWFAVDGGNHLVFILLLLSALMNATGSPAEPRHIAMKPVLVGASNVAFFVARVELALVYLSSGIAKVEGSAWRSGEALATILRHPAWSDGFIGDFISRRAGLSAALGYGVMAFELSFAALILWPRARPALLLLGALLHASIAHVMGLFFFSFAMIAAYALLLPEPAAEAALGVFRRRKRS